jgi:hypothetical protein
LRRGRASRRVQKCGAGFAQRDTRSSIDEAGEGETADFCELWKRIESEISASWGLVLYAERSDFPLKGAFVEVGMALALRKPIAVVIDFEPEGDSMRPIGSWLAHPLVCRVPSVTAAFNVIRDPRSL